MGATQSNPPTSPQPRFCEHYYKVVKREQISGGGPYTINIMGDVIFASVPTTVWPIVFVGDTMLHFGVVAEGKWICGKDKTPYKYCLSHAMPDKKDRKIANLRVEFTNNFDIIKETIQRCSHQQTGDFVEGKRVLIDPTKTPLKDYNKVADRVFDVRTFRIEVAPTCVSSDGKQLAFVTSSVDPKHVHSYNYVNCKRYFQTVASVFKLIFPAAQLTEIFARRNIHLDDNVKDKESESRSDQDQSE